MFKWYLRVFILEIAVLSLCRSVLAEEVEDPTHYKNPHLFTAATLSEFLESNSTNKYYLSLTGAINYIGSGSRAKTFVLEDKTGRIEIFNAKPPLPPVGSIVKIKGETYISPLHEPWMFCSEITVIRHAPPGEDLVVPLADTLRPEATLRIVRTEADVIDVFQDEISPDYDYLLLKDGETVISAASHHNPALKKLVDARISIRGMLANCVHGQRKFTGPCIFFDSIDDISVQTPPPTDPFDFPELKRMRYVNPREIALLGKRSARGTVLVTWQHAFYLRDGNGNLICVQPAKDEVMPRYGQNVTVAGYPETDLFRISLSRARVRVEPSADFIDDMPEMTSVEDILTTQNGETAYNDSHRGKLVTVSGVVRALPSPASEEVRMLLDCGRFKVPVDYSSNPSAANGLSIGCEIAVTGRCLLETDRWDSENIFPHIRGLTLVIRKPDDIRVLSRPSWWTPARLLLVIAGLFTALVVIIIWNRLLQRLVERRGRELYRAEIDKTKTELKIDERTRLAVELHDSISQALAGIAYQLTSSKDAVKADADIALSRIETADRMLKSCRTELRHRLHDLRSDMLEEPDFEQAVRKTISQLEGDAKIVLRVNVRRSLMNDTTAQDILSVIRELVSNALHHGQAQTVKIAGCADKDALRFSVRDDGIGFDPENAPGARQGHFGLVGIRYRLKRQNGDLSIDSSVNGGTRVSFEIPLTNDESPSEDICK